MADLTISELRLIEKGEILSLPSDETLVVGDAARHDVTDGQATGAKGTDATEAQFIGLVGAIDAGQVVELWGDGCLVTLGTALSGVNYGVTIYLSDTDKKLATTSGESTVAKAFGEVVAVRNQVTTYKALRIRKGL